VELSGSILNDETHGRNFVPRSGLRPMELTAKVAARRTIEEASVPEFREIQREAFLDRSLFRIPVPAAATGSTHSCLPDFPKSLTLFAWPN
jgi:hypothetical protein